MEAPGVCVWGVVGGGGQRERGRDVGASILVADGAGTTSVKRQGVRSLNSSSLL